MRWRSACLRVLIALTAFAASGCKEDREADCQLITEALFQMHPVENEARDYAAVRSQIRSETVKLAADQYLIASVRKANAFLKVMTVGDDQAERDAAESAERISHFHEDRAQDHLHRVCNRSANNPLDAFESQLKRNEIVRLGDFTEVEKALEKWNAKEPEPAPTPVAPKATPKQDSSGLPPFSFSLRSSTEKARAVQLNGAGLKLHKAGDYTSAAQKFREAVQADPGHLKARYNLSCALSKSDSKTAHFDVLKQLRVEDCPACLARLIRAQKDSDWDDSREDPRFQAIVDGVEKLIPSQRISALQVRDWVKNPNLKAPAIVSPRTSVKATILCGNCAPGQSKPTTRTAEGPADLVSWSRDLTQNGVRVVAGDKLKCTGDCCQFSGADLGVGHGVVNLEEVCFVQDGDQSVDLRSVSVSSH